MSLNGIDISSHQSAMNVAAVPADFVVVKATQGTGYVNPCFRRHAAQTLASGKLLGVYHYSTGVGAAEIQHFWNTAGSFKTSAVYVIDWESYKNAAFENKNVLVAEIRALRNLSGRAPVVYIPGYKLNTLGKAAEAEGCELWVAAYRDKSPVYGYQTAIWQESRYKRLMRQYTDSLRLSGYGGGIDGDVFYGTQADWQKLISGNSKTAEEKQNGGDEEMMNCIIQINDESGLTYYDGVNLHPLAHPDEVNALDIVAMQTTGHKLPRFKLGSDKAPWGTRFRAAVTRK